MDMLASANINKAELYRAIGFAKPSHSLSVKCSACHSCDYFRSMSSYGHDSSASKLIYNEHCSSCPKKKKYDDAYSNSEIVYSNEKNKYGTELPDFKLSKLSIKLFMLYHFIPSLDKRSGVIPSVNIHSLTKVLGCSVTAIKSCNKQLLDGGYIYYTSSGHTVYDILIKHYKNAFKPAAEGGRGYIGITREVYTSISKINNINSLRITLRALLKALSVSKEIQTAGNTRTIDIPVNDIRNGLPRYCKPNIIKKCLDKAKDAVSNIFESFSSDNISNGRSLLSFRCNDSNISAHCHYKKLLYSLTSKYDEFIRSFIDDFSYLYHNAGSFKYSKLKNRDFFEPDMTESYIKLHFKSLTLFPSSKEWKETLLKHIYTYGMDIVRSASKLFFDTYYLTGRRYDIHNPGGLMNELIKQVISLSST